MVSLFGPCLPDSGETLQRASVSDEGYTRSRRRQPDGIRSKLTTILLAVVITLPVLRRLPQTIVRGHGELYEDERAAHASDRDDRLLTVGARGKSFGSLLNPEGDQPDGKQQVRHRVPRKVTERARPEKEPVGRHGQIEKECEYEQAQRQDASRSQAWPSRGGSSRRSPPPQSRMTTPSTSWSPSSGLELGKTLPMLASTESDDEAWAVDQNVRAEPVPGITDEVDGRGDRTSTHPDCRSQCGRVDPAEVRARPVRGR